MNLDHLAELEAAATPRPWFWRLRSAFDSRPAEVWEGDEVSANGVVTEFGGPRDADASLIAAARNALPALIEVARAMHEVRRMVASYGGRDAETMLCDIDNLARAALAKFEPQTTPTDVGEGGDGLRGYDGEGTPA